MTKMADQSSDECVGKSVQIGRNNDKSQASANDKKICTYNKE